MYSTILMDPPWNETGGGKIKRGADKHYPLVKTPDLPRHRTHSRMGHDRFALASRALTAALFHATKPRQPHLSQVQQEQTLARAARSALFRRSVPRGEPYKKPSFGAAFFVSQCPTKIVVFLYPSRANTRFFFSQKFYCTEW
jgi:hypothetical protein